ncbi:MAG TPA: NifB/NifX family molybdenum-iron cluster-binding protein [Phycisphaerae bacterium]|nr:NifB/NifX family molybdenum-iron cluster-binding protein [Phycisphaerae bacterium]
MWSGRVSPVFDVAKRLVVADIEDGREARREEADIDETDLARRVERVAELGVEVLICGAISIPLETMLLSAGVRVIPHTCGSAEEVLRAFASGRFTDAAFLMPGCCGRRRRGRRRGGQRRLDTLGNPP